MLSLEEIPFLIARNSLISSALKTKPAKTEQSKIVCTGSFSQSVTDSFSQSVSRAHTCPSSSSDKLGRTFSEGPHLELCQFHSVLCLKPPDVPLSLGFC